MTFDPSRPSVRGEFWARAAAALWMAVMLATLAVGAFGSAELRARLAEDGPGCPFRSATTIRCAFCGMTHATIALGHGDWRAAFADHALAPVVLLLMLAACAAITFGRGDALMVGRRPYYILLGIGLIWAINLLS